MWKPYITIDAVKGYHRLEQIRVVKFDTVATESEAQSIAKKLVSQNNKHSCFFN